MRSPEHQHDLTALAHEHHYAMAGADARAGALWQVTWITLAAMLLELAAGWWSGSLALTADGWHMGTHALALGGAALAMKLSRRAANSRRFAFGGWKIEVLAAYSSALLLLAVALSLVLQAVDALRQPRAIAYEEAIVVALLGLGVNLLCAWLLARRAGPGDAHAHAHDDTLTAAAGDRPPQRAHHAGQGHGRDHAHRHGHGHSQRHADSLHGDAAHGHADPNFHAAWLHVVADALTSVLALLALAGGLWGGWSWLDPAVALVGAVVIARWGLGVLVSSARSLVDASGDTHLSQQVRQVLEADGDTKVADLHVWQVGAQAFAAAISVVADAPLEVAVYRERLRGLTRLRHVTLEVHRCAAPGQRPPSDGTQR